MKRIFKLFSLLSCVAVFTFCIIGVKQEDINAPVRDVELSQQNVDYESIFNQYENAKLEYSKNEGYVSFSGTIHYSSEELCDVDLVNITNNDDEDLAIEYSFDYDIDENLFYMNVEATNTENGTILDRIVGVPFENDKGEVDIVFDVEGDCILLSELTEKELFENCGWFSKLLKKVAVAAAVVAVAAVVVAACAYAAPAVIAVATGSLMTTTAGTTVFVAGTVATSTLATCATVAAAATTTALVAGSVAATACLLLEQSNVLEDFNNSVSSKYRWTVAELQKVLALATCIVDRKLKNTVVYLGRDPEYTVVAGADYENNVVTFHLDDWMFYEDKHTKAGMWVLNYAFMNYVVTKEKSDNWEIRLTTDYSFYIPARQVHEEGYFYSKELEFLLSTGHRFASEITTRPYGLFYQVYCA